MEAHPETRNARKGEGARGGTDVSFPTAWLSDPHFNNLPQASVGLLVRLIMESANLRTDGKLEKRYITGESTLLWIKANPDWEEDLPPLEAWGILKTRRRSDGRVESVRLDWSEQASALYLETQAKRNRRNVKQARERQKKADLEQKKQAEKLAENFAEISLETSQKPPVTSVTVSGYGSDYVGKDKDRIGKDKDRTKEEDKNLASSLSGAPPLGLSSAPPEAWSAPYSEFEQGGRFEQYANRTGEPNFNN